MPRTFLSAQGGTFLLVRYCRLYDSMVIAVHAMPSASQTSATSNPEMVERRKEMMALSSRLGEVRHRWLLLEGAVW